MKELPRGEWITFNMPVEIYKETLHVNKKLYTARQMFNQLSIDAFIMLVKPEAYTVYISSITLATQPTDDTLGNNFTKLTTDNIRVSSGSVEQGTFFGKENAIKITSTDPWANIFVKPGKTYEELSAYSKLKMTLYVEAPAQIELYSQIRLYGAAANDFYSYGTIQPGAWIEIEIDMARIMDLYAGLYLTNNPFMIVRGNDFTSITIAEMICE